MNRKLLEFQVRSDPGADGTGSVTVENGVVFEGSYFAQYESVQVSGAFDPSICEVYFVISSLQVSMSISLSVIAEMTDPIKIKYGQY